MVVGVTLTCVSCDFESRCTRCDVLSVPVCTEGMGDEPCEARAPRCCETVTVRVPYARTCVRRRLDLVDVAVLEIRELKRVHDVGVAEGAGGGGDPKVALKRCGRER